MKMFFTYFIAILLLCLCILEKESSNRAIESENDIELPAISSEMRADKIFLIPSGFRTVNNLIENEEPDKIDFQQPISTDSLRFHFGTEKAENKIF